MKIITSPVINTQRLQLVPATPRDLSYLQSLWSLQPVGQYLFDGQKVDMALARDALDSCLVGASAGTGLWLIHYQQQKIGCAGLVPVRLAPEEEPRIAGLLEPIVALHPDYWRQGFALESMHALVSYAFTDLQVKEMAAVCDEPNLASANLLQRIGFEYVSDIGGPMYKIHTYTLTKKL